MNVVRSTAAMEYSKKLQERKLDSWTKAVFKEANVKQVGNGFRHSAISYYLAMFPDVGLSRVSRWSGDSEATCRKHYLQYLRPEAGKARFHEV